MMTQKKIIIVVILISIKDKEIKVKKMILNLEIKFFLGWRQKIRTGSGNSHGLYITKGLAYGRNQKDYDGQKSFESDIGAVIGK